MPAVLTPIHPGEVLREEFLLPLGITQYRLAKETSVPPRRINEIVQEQRGITADTALRLARFFGTSEMFWLNLQAQYDLDVQRQKLGRHLAEVRPLRDETPRSRDYKRQAKRVVGRSVRLPTGRRKTQ
jgi:addiction module HigA family antidote